MRNLRDYGLFRDEHKDFKDEMDRLRELRGKTRSRYELSPVHVVIFLFLFECKTAGHMVCKTGVT